MSKEAATKKLDGNKKPFESPAIRHGSTNIHPVSGKLQRADHGTAYPGVEVQGGSPVADGAALAPVNPAALDEGLRNSIGTSVSGSHKDLPKTSAHPAAQPGVTNPKGSNYSDKTGAAALEEGHSKEGYRCVKK